MYNFIVEENLFIANISPNFLHLLYLKRRYNNDCKEKSDEIIEKLTMGDINFQRLRFNIALPFIKEIAFCNCNINNIISLMCVCFMHSHWRTRMEIGLLKSTLKVAHTFFILLCETIFII
jgi:hypothetical protein